MTWPPTDRPIIVVDPTVRFGRPQIRGISTETIASMVMAGESMDDVADDYRISCAEVLLACWYEGSQGAYRAEWRGWADQAHRVLARLNPLDLATLSEPPDQESLAGSKAKG